jgi:hypothetical protein
MRGRSLDVDPHARSRASVYQARNFLLWHSPGCARRRDNPGAKSVQTRLSGPRGCPEGSAVRQNQFSFRVGLCGHQELVFVPRLFRAFNDCRISISQAYLLCADHACQHSAPRFGRSFFASYHAIGLPADAGGLYPRSSSDVATASVRMVCGLRGRRPFPIIPARPATSAPAYIPIQ